VPASPRITLIITTYNWPAALDLTLRSVARQSARPDEIIVADDGSGPQTRCPLGLSQHLEPESYAVRQPDSRGSGVLQRVDELA
jgi:glycosyl transferase family 2